MKQALASARSAVLSYLYWTFLHYLRSLSDLDYYVDMLNTRLSNSLKRVFVLYMIIGLISTVSLTLFTLPQLHQSLIATLDHLSAQFPAGTIIEWDAKRLSSDTTHLAISLPDSLAFTAFPANALIMDLSPEATPSAATPALIFLSADQLFINTRSGDWVDTPLSELFTTPATITRANVISWYDQAASTLTPLLGLLPFLVLIGSSIGLYLSRLIMIAIDSIIVQFIFSLLGKKIPYQKVFQLSVHLLIPVELLTQAKNVLYPGLDLPMFSLSYWLLIALLIYHLRNLQQVKRSEIKED